jgi:hypothetical protein
MASKRLSTASKRLSICSWICLEALVHGLEALVHLLLHGLEALVDRVEAFVHLDQDGLDQLALVLELLLDAHHALAQLDLVDRGRLAQGLLGEPDAEVVLDDWMFSGARLMVASKRLSTASKRLSISTRIVLMSSRWCLSSSSTRTMRSRSSIS